MPIDNRAVANWKLANNAYEHYLSYIRLKPIKYEISFTDLVYVKNFKGGSATISEPIATLPGKLVRLTSELTAASEQPAFALSLGEQDEDGYQLAQTRMLSFVDLASDRSLGIKGFGSSFASAMLHFYFPNLVPILDRRVLNGARIAGIETDSKGQVKDLVSHYRALIDYCRARLRADPGLTLRSLDRELFVEKLSAELF